jgi:hypothetical protein
MQAQLKLIYMRLKYIEPVVKMGIRLEKQMIEFRQSNLLEADREGVFSWNDWKKEVFKENHIRKAWQHLKIYSEVLLSN